MSIKKDGPLLFDQKRAEIRVEMGKNRMNETLERLIAYWQMHRHFDANIVDLSKYARVSRDTVYRWLNRKAQPRAQKDKLIQEWLNQKASQL